MRTTLALLLMTGLSASCGDEGGGIGADALYQLACPQDPAETGCGSALDPVNILAYDGDAAPEGGTVTVRCSSVDAGEGLKAVSFSVGIGNDPLLQVSGAIIPEDGGPVSGRSCRVVASQSSNRYGGGTYGVCGAAQPSEEQPCRLTAFEFDPNGEDGRELTTTLECRNLRAETAPDRLVRDLTLPMNRSAAAQLRLINCEGF